MKNSAKKDGTTSIYARVRQDGISADISTKTTVFEEYWCPSAERVNNMVKISNLLKNALDDIFT